MPHYRIILSIVFIFLFHPQCSNSQNIELVAYNSFVTAAEQTNQYLHLLSEKNVGIIANQSSIIGNKHLIDSLLNLGINIKKIFTPEHGFRGQEDAGAKVASFTDAKTGITVISLYGNKKKPAKEDLAGLDILCFDLQDVGTRFYTYISTLTYVMEACAENDVPLLVLDRPNPNAFYVDGPVLKPGFESFVGLHPVPVVYGLTIGEYALMVNGEKWLNNKLRCNLTVISLRNYHRNRIVKLPIKPSPNLPTWESIYLYPSLCFFEGTVVSIGRGTDHPFEVYGHPQLKGGNYSFVPQSRPGATNPPLIGKKCFGFHLNSYAHDFANREGKINLNWLMSAYTELKNQVKFFNNYFDTLAGSDQLRKQIEAGMTVEQIRHSWQNDLEGYKKIRVKYLLYPD